MLAVGPISILPSPLLAAVPATTPFTVSSGTATWNGVGNTGTINASNRSVLTWGTTALGDTSTLTNFVINGGDTFHFVLPSGGAVLNRVTAGTNTTNTAFGGLGAAAAVINGTLLAPNGQVLILANGNIIVGAGAQISTANGLVLSTLAESDFNFTATGNLALNGASQGNIFIGTGTTAVNVLGNLSAYAGTITSNNLTVSGDLILNQVGAGTGLVLTGTGTPTTVGGNFTATSNNGAITQGTGSLVIANGNTTLRSGTGSIALGVLTNDFRTLTVNSTGALGGVTVADANIITLGASTVGQDLTVTAVGTRDSNAISTSGALAVGGNAIFASTTENSAINIGSNTTIGSTGTINITTNNSNITFNGVGNVTTGVINSGTATNFADPATDNLAVISITTNGALTVGSGITNAAGNAVANITLTGASITQTGAITAGNGIVTLNATAGNLTTGAITANAVTLNASAGAINPAGQTGVITTSTSGTSVVRASGNINLTGANLLGSGQVLQVPAASAASINNGARIILGTSNVTGNLSLSTSAGDIVLGTGTGSGGQNVTVGGTLFATVAGTSNITDGDYSAFNVFGGVNLTTAGGNIILDGAVANGSLAPNVRFGQVRANAGAGTLTVAETTGLNLANVTAAGLNATSVTEGIINSGDINVTGTANFTTSGAATSVITNGTNTIGTVNFIGSGGSLTVGTGGVTLGAATNVTSGDDVVLTSTGAGAITLGGATVGGLLTVNSAGTIAVADGTTTTVGGSLSLTAADAGASSITQADTDARLLVTGVTTVSSSGNVVLNAGNDFMGGVVLNQAGSAGNVQVYDVNNLTISGSAGGGLDVRSGATALAIDNPWNLVLGNLNVASLTANSTNGGGGNSGTLTQAAGTSLHSEGAFTAITNNGNIVLTNSGNSAGRVAFFTNGGSGNGTATVSYTEDSTMRVGNVAANSNVTLRSNFGSIVEDTAADTAFNIRATLNATAPNGSILLGGTTNTTTTTGGNIATFTASAPSGAVAVTSNNNITLGAINANSLSVTATNNISQSGALGVFGAANFTSTNATETRSIALTNSTNNFGPLSFSVGNNTSTIAVTEANTLNLRRVTMIGGGNSTFTANSVNGDIIDTGLGGVRLGGNATVAGGGVVTLAATNGNIVLDDPTSDLSSSAGVVFNGKDVTLSFLGGASSTVVVGSSSGPSQATGNLTVSTALGSIANAGPLTAGGTAYFQSPNGNISIGGSGVGFGMVKFLGNQVSINEAGNMDISTGSSAFGPANLISGGSITIVNVGGGTVTFGNTVTMNATGTITLPKLVQAVGLLTVNHTGTADLSALSIAGDLGGISPVSGGTGTYVPPAP